MTGITVIPGKIHILPFEILSWEEFQLFCTDLLFKQYNAVDSREYLSQGSKQEGIDIYLIKRGEEKKTVAQCKLKEYIGPRELQEIVDAFLIGEFAQGTNQFILCTNADLNRQRDTENNIEEARKKLGVHGIEFVVWDQNGLSLELRTTQSPDILNIVYHYFNADICLHFYGDLWLDHIRKINKIRKLQRSKPDGYIDRTVISLEERLQNTAIIKQQSLIQVFGTTTKGKSKKIVLLSTAGFGKSDELRSLTAYFSQEQIPVYPVTYSLRDYEGENIEDILATFDNNWRHIEDENLFLIFDGLDEIGSAFIPSFFKRMNAFSEQHPSVMAIISSRYNFYDIRHQPMRGFEPYLLNPLTQTDIDSYLEKYLPQKKGEFYDVLKQKKFIEYSGSPYYFTRMVRFYKDNPSLFPKNKTELFDKILFERITKDEFTYDQPELRRELLPAVRQIAFCMTVSGKSSLSDDEFRLLIPDFSLHKKLNLFCALNRSQSNIGSWSFEHKNLQEYLSASVFADCTFFDLHKIIADEHDHTKLLPKFVNTIAFLFELLNSESSLFKELLQWIKLHDPELLVRFEKEQLSKDTRNEIFFHLFNSYKEQGLSFWNSSNFSLNELADFVEVDNTIIEFIGKELSPRLPNSLVFDCLNLICMWPRAYVIKTKICDLLLSILTNSNYDHEQQASAIRSFYVLRFLDQEIFEKILCSGIDITNFKIREAALLFLEETDYCEVYASFIVESVEIFKKSRNDSFYSDSYSPIKRLLLTFQSPRQIKDILSLCNLEGYPLDRRRRQSEFQFDLLEFQKLLEKAALTYKSDKSILPIVYRLYCRIDYISAEHNWNNLFLQFFENTCGKEILFDKFYKHRHRTMLMLNFASEKSCDFLVSEYLAGKLTVQEIIVLRNVLTHINQELFRYFYDLLVTLPGQHFTIDDLEVDYNAIWNKQAEKNQLMLLHKKLFMEEAETIFHIIAKNEIRKEDLWFSTNVQLRPFRDSLVLNTIRDVCAHDEDKMISPDEFYSKFFGEFEWNIFTINEINSLLEKQKEGETILPGLVQKISNWCKDEIGKIDFERHSIIDKEDGTYTYFPHTEFVKRTFVLLDLSISDQLMLKILVSDYAFFDKQSEKVDTIAEKVIAGLQDKLLLKETVINNLRNKLLSYRVHLSHFRICSELGYSECLPFLYKFLIENVFIPDYDRVTLTKMYLKLGGGIIDFSEYLTIPDQYTENKIEAWQWYLLDKLLYIEKQKVMDIMLSILNNPDSSIEHKLKAAQALIRLSNLQGLQYWVRYLVEQRKFAFDHKWESLQQFIGNMSFQSATDLLFEALDFHFSTGLHDKWDSRKLEDALFSSLLSFALKDYEHFKAIKERLLILGNIHKQGTAFKRRLIARYYEDIAPRADIVQANLLYNKLFS